MASKRGKKKASTRRARSSDEGLDLGSEKLYFKIGEVAEIVGVEPYVLRYWETEFRAVKPQKSRSQQRVYRRRDVETLLKIKDLLYRKKFTIAGARQQLKDAPEACEAAAPAGAYLARRSLGEVRDALADLRTLVERDAGDPAMADPAAYVAALLQEPDGNGFSHQPLLSRPER